MKRASASRRLGRALAGLSLAACSTAGSTWMEEPLTPDDEALLAPEDMAPPPSQHAGEAPRPKELRAVTIGGVSPDASDSPPQATSGGGFVKSGGTAKGGAAGGRSLGTFRNTYYDFPSEAEFDGPTATLYDRECKALATTPKAFYEAVCVQGSGTLRRGSTVSFSRRDCGCADVCPRTGQKICFDELDARQFPWGRGATGKAITPLLTVAVDADVIPLGTAIYVPELEGLPRDASGTVAHDGCFVAQDRGLKVKGKHVDVFTGDRSVTALWNQRVPSNRGVTVVLDHPRCARAGTPARQDL
jgi:3D (Asp-Asp-Asp) domain-containing protein